MAPHYRVGTVAVTNGSATITGSATGWTSQVKEGDEFEGPDGAPYEVAAVNSNTSLTLAEVYGGSTASGQSYAIKRYSGAWSSVADLSLRISNFLQNLVGVFGGTGVPSDTLGSDGSYYFRVDTGIADLYRKASGTWSLVTSLRGPAGAIGPGFSATSTSTVSIGTGLKGFTLAGGASGVPYIGARMRAAVTSAPTNYLEGIVTAATTSTITINAEVTAGSGSHSAWSIVASGNPGVQGEAGPASTGTSTTSLTIGIGTKTMTTQAGLDLIAGQVVRIADQAAPATNWMQGTITAYTGTSLTISVPADGSSAAGSGTIAAWNIGLTGARGATGATGAASTVPGPGYAGTSTSSVSVGAGSKTFATQTGLAYVPGSRVRVSSAASPSDTWMEGVVTSYATGSMVVDVGAGNFAGAGTISDWTISIAGERGTDGADGAVGLGYNPRGTYDIGTTYTRNDTVTVSGTHWVYVNTADSFGNAPPTLPTTGDAYWELVAQKGADGSGAVSSVNSQTGDVVLNAANISTALSPNNYAPPGPSIEQHLSGINAALATAGTNGNLLINGDGAINQRAAAAGITDDTYHVDRWYALTQTGAVDVSVVNNAAPGVSRMIRLTQAHASAQRMGDAQIVESLVALRYRGKTVTLSGEVALSASGTVRYAILEWTGAPNVVTSDVINNWASTTYTPGNFFASTSIVVAAEGSLAVSAGVVTPMALSAEISTSATNLIVVLWTSATVAQTGTLSHRSKLELGPVASAWNDPDPALALALCMRRFQRVTTPANGSILGVRVGGSLMRFDFLAMYQYPMASTPTISHSSPGYIASAPGNTNQIAALSIVTSTYITITGSLTLSTLSALPNARTVSLQASTAFSGSAGDLVRVQFGGLIYFDFDAEL